MPGRQDHEMCGQGDSLRWTLLRGRALKLHTRGDQTQRPQDQESCVPPTEPAGRPSALLFTGQATCSGVGGLGRGSGEGQPWMQAAGQTCQSVRPTDAVMARQSWKPARAPDRALSQTTPNTSSHIPGTTQWHEPHLCHPPHPRVSLSSAPLPLPIKGLDSQKV